MEQPVMLYRHSPAVTIIYCVACTCLFLLLSFVLFCNVYNPISFFFTILDVFVFILGLIGNCLVVAVVFRVPQMRTVTNYFIVINKNWLSWKPLLISFLFATELKVNLAIADILVVLFCLPATLLSNIFVRKSLFNPARWLLLMTDLKRRVEQCINIF